MPAEQRGSMTDIPFRKEAHTLLHVASTTVGYGTLVISSLYNPWYLLSIPAYAFLTNHVTPLLSDSARTVLDPTNALAVTLMQPHMQSTLETIDLAMPDESLDPVKEWLVDNKVGVMTISGSCRDATNYYGNHNAAKTYKLSNEAAALVKYTTVYFCKTLIPIKGFSERNNMCVGLGEGAILATNAALDNSLASVDSATSFVVSVIPRIAFEWLIYKGADGARWQVREHGVLDSAINLIPTEHQAISKTFAAEWTYAITTNFPRLITRPIEKAITDGVMSICEKTDNDEMPAPYEHNDMCFYNESNLAIFEELHQISDQCFP